MAHRAYVHEIPLVVYVADRVPVWLHLVAPLGMTWFRDDQLRHKLGSTRRFPDVRVQLFGEEMRLGFFRFGYALFKELDLASE